MITYVAIFRARIGLLTFADINTGSLGEIKNLQRTPRKNIIAGTGRTSFAAAGFPQRVKRERP
jgi:hypothetical protein